LEAKLNELYELMSNIEIPWTKLPSTLLGM